jgi:uncharacterized protein (DUF885 family)
MIDCGDVVGDSDRVERTPAVHLLQLALVIFLASAVTLAGMPAQSAEEKTEVVAANDFQKLISEYLNDLHSRHPAVAAASGIHSWDNQLEDYSAAAIADEIAAIKRFQARLERIPAIALGFSDLIDYQIISSNMKSRLLELEDIRSFQRNPQIYSDAISNGLLLLAIFDYAPAEVRLQNVIAKENQIPRLLDSARANIHSPPAIYLKLAAESFRGTLNFVQSDLPKAFASVKDARLRRQFEKATRIAAGAIWRYIKHLEKIKAEPATAFAIGRQNYEAKLRYDEGIDVPVDVLLKIAVRELSNAQEEFRKAAARLDPKRDPLKVWAEVQAEHPRAGTLVEEARKQLSSLVSFLKERQIVTLPEDDLPLVQPTPDFLRWSTASMWTPGPFEVRPIPARYFITDVDPSWSEKQKEEYLSSLNFAQLWTTSIHEAYPGHFVQALYLKRVKSVVRKTWALAPTSFVEGWAHYAEQMMIDEGFGKANPKLRMGQLADALLRLCRFVVGIREHTQGMTIEQATRFFMQNAYMGETPARIEAERGSFDPTYIVYTLGKLAILKMREDYKRERGAEFSLRDFHDRLLSNGLAPLWAHRRMLMPGDRGKLIE